jgi:hypothetical protein
VEPSWVNVLTYASFSGSFSSSNLPALTGLKQWSLTNSETVTTLSVVKAKPALAIARSAGNFSITGSSEADTGAVLQSATSLAPPPLVWQNVTNDVQVIGDKNVVTVPLKKGSVFFRLLE